LPAHIEMPFDLADGPVLGPVQLMQFAGPIRRRSISIIQTCAGTELLFARPSAPVQEPNTCSRML
jgi:hypothetical protein